MQLNIITMISLDQLLLIMTAQIISIYSSFDIKNIWQRVGLLL